MSRRYRDLRAGIGARAQPLRVLLTQLFYLWQLENPSSVEKADIYAALDESLEDIQAGRTDPVETAMAEIRAKHELGE